MALIMNEDGKTAADGQQEKRDAATTDAIGDVVKQERVSVEGEKQASRKKRRPRKRGKGDAGKPPVAEAGKEEDAPAAVAKAAKGRPMPSAHDPVILADCAWKIYLAEISEEGVTLVDDAAAKDLAKRCFRLATIFLDEQSRQG